MYILRFSRSECHKYLFKSYLLEFLFGVSVTHSNLIVISSVIKFILKRNTILLFRLVCCTWWCHVVRRRIAKEVVGSDHSCQTALLLAGRPAMPFFCPAFWTLPWEALLLPSFGTHLSFLLGFFAIYQSYTISDRDFSKIYLKIRSPLL